MKTLDELLDSLKIDAPVRTVLVGAHWTVVCSHSCGMASTLIDTHIHGTSQVRDVGRLHGKSAQALKEVTITHIIVQTNAISGKYFI